MTPPNDRLLEAAREASKQAYIPYSGFPVGAAVMTDGGEIFRGCNIENASYGLTICAERVAIFNAVTAGARKIVGLAVTCPRGNERKPGTLMPCGACRQVIAQFASAETDILVDGLGVFKLKDIFPQPFEI